MRRCEAQWRRCAVRANEGEGEGQQNGAGTEMEQAGKRGREGERGRLLKRQTDISPQPTIASEA